MSTVDRFRAAVDHRDLTALEALLTEDVRLYSPVKFTPFEGRAMVMALFGVLIRTFEDLHYIGRFEGSVEAAADGAEGPAGVLAFRATVNGKQINGIDMLHLATEDAEGAQGGAAGEGLIKEITVMVRPQSAVQTLGEAVLAGLVADGVVS